MRILLTTWGWPSHLYAMVPLGWACRAAGHEVLVASEPGFLDTVRRTGLPVAGVGHDVDAVTVFRDIARPSAGPGGGGPRVLRLLAELADSMTADLIRLGDDWAADLLVFEPTTLAGPLAAAALGLPAVRHLYGTDLLAAAAPFVTDALAPLRDRLGLAEVDPFGVASVDPCPAGLQLPTGSPRLPMRYVPYNGPGTRPAGLPPASGRPRVCVTWGTTLDRLDPELFLARRVLAAIADLDVEPVVAVRRNQRALLGQVPAGVHVLESAPLDLLLNDCDLVIAHGGAGTILTALSHGVPQLLIPRLPDHVRHAARVEAAGAGAVLPPDEAEPARIRELVTGLLADPAHRTAAGGLAARMHAQPTPAELVPELVRPRRAVREPLSTPGAEGLRGSPGMAAHVGPDGREHP